MSNAAQEEQKAQRWRGLLKRQVQVPADKAWSVVREFCGLHKWIKTIRVCELIEGEEGKPGCVRSLRGTTFAKPGTGESWATERLIFLDDENKSHSYELLESSMGVGGYQAWMKFDHVDDKSCMVTWNYEANPIEGTTEEALAQNMTSKYGMILDFLEEYNPSS